MKTTAMLLATVLFMLPLVACGESTPPPSEETSPAAPAGEVSQTPETEPETEKLNIVVSFHDPTLPWGQPAKTAVEDAAKEFGVNVDFIGPTPTDPVKQLEQIKTLYEQGKIDGLAIAPLEDKTLRPYIDELSDNGIPVVTFTTDSPESKRLAFYGQGFESLETIAYELTKKTIELLPEKKGKVAILNSIPDLESLIKREEGSKRAIAEYPDLEYIGTFANKADFQDCYADVEALMTANPDIVALFAEDSFTTPSAAKVLRDMNLNDKVKLSGYDMTEEALLLVRDGNLDILVGQNPYMQGYLSVKALYECLTEDVAPVSVEVEAEYATPQNIDEFLQAYNVSG